VESGEFGSRGRTNSPDFVEHSPQPGIPPDREGLKQLVTVYRTAFPDTQFTVEDLIVEGDKAVVRWTARGTHQQELMGIPPTGKQATVTGIDIYRIKNGMTAEHWGNFDQLGLLQQLGVIPAPGQPGG
jgi:steroid delta-isomerase-like uncharacterized protein